MAFSSDSDHLALSPLQHRWHFPAAATRGHARRLCLLGKRERLLSLSVLLLERGHVALKLVVEAGEELVDLVEGFTGEVVLGLGRCLLPEILALLPAPRERRGRRQPGCVILGGSSLIARCRAGVRQRAWPRRVVRRGPAVPSISSTAVPRAFPAPVFGTPEPVQVHVVHEFGPVLFVNRARCAPAPASASPRGPSAGAFSCARRLVDHHGTRVLLRVLDADCARLHGVLVHHHGS
mmetsp:Transcript_8888/g.24541  ORF Transcript_8888/g.24541 Transcript_8888/m.24541 type:complete len:236 (-) Transcript_8888:1132-1839(-)